MLPGGIYSSGEKKQASRMAKTTIPEGPCRYMVNTQGPKASHIPTLKPKYIPCNYMDPMGMRISEE